MPAKIPVSVFTRLPVSTVISLTAVFLVTLASVGAITTVSADIFTELMPNAAAPSLRFSTFDAEPDNSDLSSERRECAASANVRWLPHSNVKISYARGQFTEKERVELHRAISLWQKALLKMELGIVLEDGGEVEMDAEPTSAQIIVKRDYSMDSNHYGKIVAAARPDNYLDRGFILINGSLTKGSSLRKTMLHELGHGFGLKDCSSCPSGATVMNSFFQLSFMGLNIGKAGRKISDKPSRCDVATVAAGYRHSELELARNSTVDPQPSFNRQVSAPLHASFHVEPLSVAMPARELSTASRNSQVLTETEKIEFESYVPTLLGKEAETMAELNNYTFTRVVRIQTIDSKGRVSGEYRRTSDLVFDDSGQRIERGWSLSKSTLRRLKISPEYVEDFSGVQLKGFELSKRDHYRIEPFMTETLDGTRMRVYRMTPLDLNAERAAQTRVFFGYVWVEDTTGRILKIGGLALPDGKQRFPLFETQRALVDGKHLFPVHTIADDYLVFSSHTVHVRMLITYSNYKRFESRVRVVEVDD